MNKKLISGAVILCGVSAVIALAGQYATGDSALLDYAGNAAGWVKGMLQRIQNAAVGATGGDVSALDLALPIIKQFEGFVGHAYTDQVGIWTIGYGHKIITGDGYYHPTKNPTGAKTISESDASDLLAQDASGAWNCVRNATQTSISNEQTAALISFTFNVGCGNFTSSTLLKCINNSDWSGADAEFARWNHAGGQVLSDLTDRRSQEAALFESNQPTDGSDFSSDNTQYDSSDDSGA